MTIAMRILIHSFCFFDKFLIGLHPLFLSIFIRFSISWRFPGHTVHSVFVLDMSEDGTIREPASRSCS